MAKNDQKTMMDLATDDKRRFKIRSHDGFELLKMILDDNPALKQRVLYFIERTLGKKPEARK